MLIEMLLWKSGIRKSAHPSSGFLLICPTITLELSAKDLVMDTYRTVRRQVSSGELVAWHLLHSQGGFSNTHPKRSRRFLNL
jgi:hypothetical protein